MNINRRSETFINYSCRISRQKMFSRLCPLFFDSYAFAKSRFESGFNFVQNQTGTAMIRVYTNKFLGTVPRLPVPRLPPGGSLGTGKISGTGAVLFLGTLCLHVEN